MEHPLERISWSYLSCHVYLAKEPGELAILIRPLCQGMRDWFVVGNSDVTIPRMPTATLEDLLTVGGVMDPHATHAPHAGAVQGYARVRARLAPRRGRCVIALYDWSVNDLVSTCVSREDIHETLPDQT